MPNKPLSCVIIGSGFSGIAMGIKLKEQGINDFIILEKAEDVGGTWRENTYPGAECDIPSALYSYSFEPNPYWKYKWSMQPQILDYIRFVAKKYELYPHIHFQKEMTAASWMEDEGHWHIKVRDGSTYLTKTFISAIGQLHHPHTPDFKGKELFEGTSFHSAKWNHEISLKGKKVGVIGNAASAVQFIPEITKVAKEVVVFQRSANWMLPKQDRSYKEWEKKLVAKLPILLKTYRKRLWIMSGGLFFMMKQKGTITELVRQFYQGRTLHYIKKHIKDPELVKTLTPNYPMGAKRLLFSDTYYPALARPNVSVVTGGIQEISADGVITGNGKKEKIDTLIFATGFKTNPFLLGLDIKGQQGLSIQNYWEEGPRNYLGMTMNGFPNMFMMYGPNTNLGHSSILLMSEAQAGYIAQCVSTIEKYQWKSIEIKGEVIDKYYKNTQDRLKKMIWATVEKSWYKSDNGHIPNNYPGRTMEYMKATKKVNFEDYEIKRYK